MKMYDYGKMFDRHSKYTYIWNRANFTRIFRVFSINKLIDKTEDETEETILFPFFFFFQCNANILVIENTACKKSQV